jgi:HK97 family phage portal protein
MARKKPAQPTTRRRAPRRTTPEKRAVGSVWSPVASFGFGTISPADIGTTEAIRVSSILAVVRWIAQAVAVMPVQVMRTLPGGRKEDADLPCSYTLRKRPNGWQSAYDFYQLVAYWTALHGNAFARVMPGPRGFCSELRPMHPSRVNVVRNRDYSVSYQFWNDAGSWETIREPVIHWRWLSDNGLVGMAPSELCGTSIALARQLDIAATAFWANSARPDMVMELQEKIPDEAMTALRAQLREIYGGARNRGSIAVLPKKTQLKPIESNSMEANQYQELRDSILPDIARAWGVPSTLVGDHKMARWSNVEQEHLSAQVWCLLPWARRMEGPLDMMLQPVYGEDVYARLDNRGILRADTASRVQLYQALFNMGALKPQELREMEDLPLLEDPAANETYMQLGFSTLGNAAAPEGGAVVADGEPPADEPAGDERAPGAGVPEAGGFREGQYVYWDGGEGTIEHLMVDGVLGVEGSPFAITATEADPAASLRVYEDGEPTEFTVGKRVADLSAEPLDEEPEA